MIYLYNLIWIYGLILIVPWIMLDMLISRKRRKTVFHRLGLIHEPRIDCLKKMFRDPHPIWIHALSVGEVHSAAVFSRRLKLLYPEIPVVFSASTLTGYETACRILNSDVDAVIYFPYDLIFSVRSVISRIRPRLMIFIETDIWPNFLFELKRRSVPILLLNARLSDRSFSGYKRFLHFTQPVLQCISAVGAQSPSDARRFQELGVLPEHIATIGNLKYDQQQDISMGSAVSTLQKIFSAPGECKILVAGSTHPGEETVILSAFSSLRKNGTDIYLVIVPRNIERAKALCSMAHHHGFSTELLTRMDQIRYPSLPDVVIVNTIGDLQSIYALSDIAFVGGSLVDFGGHNPLEAAAFGKPVLLGPYFGDVSESCNPLLTAGGARVVRDETALCQTVQWLIDEPEQAEIMGKKALEVVQNNQGAVDRALKFVAGYIR